MEFLASLFPATVFGWVVQVIGSVIASYFLLSLAEYLFHRYLMHQGIAERVYAVAPPLHALLYAHRKLHHETFYQQFDHEDDPFGKEVNLRLGFWHTAMGVVCFLPYFIVTAWFISLVPTIVFCLCASAHNLTWNVIHAEMHQPKHPFWSQWRVYRFLARNHFVHHHHTRTNFNIVCPFFDYALGTLSFASDNELTELRRLGFAD